MTSLIPAQPTLSDFPKLQCPYIRQTFQVDHDSWKKAGAKLGLRKPEAYLVVNRVNPGFEWVFDDKDTIAVEKLDGSNVKILTENGRLTVVQNRLNVIDPLQIMTGKSFIIEGIFQAIGKGYVEQSGEQVGELIGPKLQGNPYKLAVHEWYPFAKTLDNLKYRSFHEHERSFENLDNWFKDHLFSRFFMKRASKMGSDEKVFSEGVIFYNLKRQGEGKSWRAKLRRNMYPWYFESQGLKVLDYIAAGKDQTEDQEAFD